MYKPTMGLRRIWTSENFWKYSKSDSNLKWSSSSCSETVMLKIKLLRCQQFQTITFCQKIKPEEEGGQTNHEYLSKQDYKVSHLVSRAGYHQWKSKWLTWLTKKPRRMFEVMRVKASWEALQKFDPTIAVMMYAFLEVSQCDDIVYQFRKQVWQTCWDIWWASQGRRSRFVETRWSPWSTCFVLWCCWSLKYNCQEIISYSYCAAWILFHRSTCRLCIRLQLSWAGLKPGATNRKRLFQDGTWTI